MLSFSLKDKLTKDDELRLSAFNRVRELQNEEGEVRKIDLLRGFMYQSEKIGLVQGQQGIYKPRQMDILLSVTTVVRNKKSKFNYESHQTVHQSIFAGDAFIEYDFMRGGSHRAQNQYLKKAMETQTPIIYFLGVEPGIYLALLPTYIIAWDPETNKCRLAFDIPDKDEVVGPPDDTQARYSYGVTKRRLHQSLFRRLLLNAYQERCTITGLREAQLLDAAHIIPDRDEELGQPITQNGLLMSKIHHAAFDANLFGIDPDFVLHVSERLLSENDGPMLNLLKTMNGNKILLPRNSQDYPDRDRLALRFESFQSLST